MNEDINEQERNIHKKQKDHLGKGTSWGWDSRRSNGSWIWLKHIKYMNKNGIMAPTILYNKI